MHTRLSFIVSRVDLLAELSSCSLLWHSYVTAFSVLPSQHYEARDLHPLQLAECLRKQHRSKESLFWLPQQLGARSSNMTIKALLLYFWHVDPTWSGQPVEEERMCQSSAIASCSVPVQSLQAGSVMKHFVWNTLQSPYPFFTRLCLSRELRVHAIQELAHHS